MSVGRVLSSLVACAAVAGCAVVAIGISSADSALQAGPSGTPSVVLVPHEHAVPVVAPAIPTTPAASSSSSHPVASPRSAISTSPSAPRPAARPTSSAKPTTSHPAPAPATHATVKPAQHTAAPRPTHHTVTVTVTGHRLPLGYSTGSATRVITVVAHSHASTTATLQAWTKVSGGWQRYGSAVTAHVGADGLGNASEYRSATPTGSFTLTQAFGYYRNPGTALRYLHTTPVDWWISQAGSLYNTHQRCSGRCPFTQGSPNEHLYYETPYYNYAVVIDYNTRNAPGGVHQGRGSAFFLHVTDGNPTAGCVAIPQSRLVTIMRWLRPSAHPRILIGVT